MGTRIACLFFLTFLSVCQAEEIPPCASFEGGVYTTVKSLNFSEATYCIGWSDLPEGAEIPLGVTPTPDFVLKPHEWTVTAVPTTPVALGETKYLLVFTASLYGPDKVYYSDMVTHAEPFTVRHVAADPSGGPASAGRVDLQNLREYQAALSEITQELRAIETIAPSIRPELEGILQRAAEMSGEWFGRDTANAHPIEGNPNYLIQLLRDTAEELNRTDSPLRSEEGLEALEAKIIAGAEADVQIAEDLIRSRFLTLPIDFDSRQDAAPSPKGTLEARQLIGLCERWGISFPEEVKGNLLGESDPAKVRARVFDHLWRHVVANRPGLDERPAQRTGFLIEAALSDRVAATSASEESRINRILDQAVLINTSQRQIDWMFYPNLRGLPSILAFHQIQPYRLHATALGPHVASAAK